MLGHITASAQHAACHIKFQGTASASLQKQTLCNILVYLKPNRNRKRNAYIFLRGCFLPSWGNLPLKKEAKLTWLLYYILLDFCGKICKIKTEIAEKFKKRTKQFSSSIQILFLSFLFDQWQKNYLYYFC